MATRLSNQVEPQPSPNVQFSAPDKTSDIVFIVERQKIHFTKAFLIACSPVFERMFEGDFAERNATEIPLPDKKYEDVVEFFKQIHPAYASLSTVTDDNLLALLALSREYGMEAVKKRCELYICKEADIRPESTRPQLTGVDFSVVPPQPQFRGPQGFFDVPPQQGFSFGGGPKVTPAKAAKPQPKLVGKQDLDPMRLILFLYACDEHDFHDCLGVLKDIASTRKTHDMERSQYWSLVQPTTLLDIYRARCTLMGI